MTERQDTGFGYNWTRLIAHRDFGFSPGDVSFHMFNKNEAGQVTAIIKQIVWEEVDPKDNHLMVFEPTPAFHLQDSACQSLMNDLWNLGIRPTNEGTIGVSEAQTKHLNDLRKIVFKTLEIES